MAERVWRLRPCLASMGPGRLGSPTAPTTRGRLRWLDEERMKGGESLPDQESLRRSRKIRSRGEKPPRWSAERRASGSFRAPAPKGVELSGGAAWRSIPSGFPRGQTEGAPGAANHSRAAICHVRNRAKRRSGACPKCRSHEIVSVRGGAEV
jgi:hypothetical protein